MQLSEVSERLSGWAVPSRAKAAAALLILSTFIPGQQPASPKQAKVFDQPASFVQTQVGRPLLINGTAAPVYNPAIEPRRSQAKWFRNEAVAFVQTTNLLLINAGSPAYDPTTDVRRAAQAQVFSALESYIRPQNAAALLVNGTAAPVYNSAIESRRPQAQVFGQPESFIQGLKTAVIGLTAYSQTDVLAGFDTVGWPEEIRVIWQPPSAGSLAVVLTSYTPYNSATDVQRVAQARVFGQIESFAQGQSARPLLVNGSASYIAQYDVQRAPQAKVFGIAESFAKANLGTALVLNGTIAGWNGIPQPQTRVFGVAEVFVQLLGAGPLVINGSASYTVQYDVQRAPQVKVFGTPESFAKANLGTALTLTGNVAGWNSIPQAQTRVFGAAESFAQPLGIARLLINGTQSYNPAIELRQPQAKWLGSPETFIVGMKPALLVLQPVPSVLPRSSYLIKLTGYDRRITLTGDVRRIMVDPDDQ